jgi:hypothetical protein
LAGFDNITVGVGFWAIFILSPISSERHRQILVSFVSGGSPLDRCDEYRRFAEACIEMARHQEDRHERAILLQMAYIWSRLAEQAAAFAKGDAT